MKPALAATRGAVVDATTLTLTYDEVLDSSSTPPASAFSVFGGASTRTVADVAVSRSAVQLTLAPPVEYWETGIEVNYTPPTGMGAAPVKDRVGNVADGLSGEPVSNETPDRVSPTVTSVEITSDPPDGRDVYGIGEAIEVTVTFDETVTVSGTARVTLKVGERDRSANYESVTGAVVLFAYTVAVNDSDTDGVSIEAGSLSGGTIRDTSMNHAVRSHPEPPGRGGRDRAEGGWHQTETGDHRWGCCLSSQRVTNNTGDTAGPAVSTVAFTSNAGSDRTYGVGDTIAVTVTRMA